MARGGRADAIPSARVEYDGQEVAEGGARERRLVSVATGQEHEPRRLCTDKLPEERRVLQPQLLRLDPHVPHEHDVEAAELGLARKLVDVAATAPDTRELRVEEQAGDLHARVALEGVAQVAVLPARVAVDDEDLQLLLADRDRRRQRVVRREDLRLVLGYAQLEGELALPGRHPNELALRLLHGRHQERVRRHRCAVDLQRDDQLLILGQRAADRERDTQRLAQHPERGRLHADELQVGQRRRAPDAHAENGYAGEPVAGRGERGRAADVPVPVGEHDHTAQIRVRLEDAREGAVEIRARLRRPIAGGEGLEHDLELGPGLRSGRAPDVRGEQRRDRVGTADRQSGTLGLGLEHVARLHAPRLVDQHREGRGLLGRPRLDPLGLAQRDRDEGDDHEAQELEEPGSPGVAAAAPRRPGQPRGSGDQRCADHEDGRGRQEGEPLGRDHEEASRRGRQSRASPIRARAMTIRNKRQTSLASEAPSPTSSSIR